MAIEDIKRDIQTVPGLKASMTKWTIGGAIAGIILPGFGSVVGALGGAAWAYHKGTRRR